MVGGAPVQQGKAYSDGAMARPTPLGFEIDFVQESGARVFYLSGFLGP
jgi:hypothetical protein